MTLPHEPFDPYDDSQRLLDADRPRPVMMYAIGSVIIAAVLLRVFVLLLAMLRSTAGSGSLAARHPLGGAGAALLPFAPVLLVLGLVVLALGLAFVMTSGWNASDRAAARMISFIVALVTGIWFALPLSFQQRANTEIVRVSAGGVASGGPASADYRPTSLEVAVSGGWLRFEPSVAAGVPGRYRVRSRVIVDPPGAEIARHTRDMDLPRLAGNLSDGFSLDELDRDYRRWRARPGSMDTSQRGALRATCEYSLARLEPDSAATPAGATPRPPLDPRASLRVSISLRLSSAGR